MFGYLFRASLNQTASTISGAIHTYDNGLDEADRLRAEVNGGGNAGGRKVDNGSLGGH
jgi:hypothetical protein